MTTLILIGVGLVLFLLGFFTEKSHLYVTPHSSESIALLQKNSSKDSKLSHEEIIRFKEIGQGVTIDNADVLLVEYYHETPFSKEEIQNKILAKAKEQNIEVTFAEFSTEHHASHSTVEADHAHGHKHGEEEHEHAHDTTDEVNHSHNHDTAAVMHEELNAHAQDGNAEEASKEEHASHESHDLVFLAMASAGHHTTDNHGHDAHGAAHSPIQTLEHIIHEEGTFADTHHGRTWSNLLVNAFFFFGIGLGALFFIALQYATESGWGVVTKRVLEAITGYLPVGAIFLILVFIGSTMDWNHIYHWMDASVMDPNSDHYDSIIAGKQPFLTKGFFWISNLFYFGVFLIFARIFRKRSLKEDIEGGTKIHMGNYVRGAIYLVLFGYLSSIMSWHWIMSIDVHWFSTLFGWYVFSGIWISGTISILLLIFFLKGQGYLEFVKDSHIHDFGKWMFAGSVLWAYLFFSQFMLIWYADIPEEVTYYIARFTDYKYILWTMFAVNLILPLIFLMSREAKRSRQTITIVGFILLVTHWLDVFIMVMPGTVYDHWDIGFLEVGMFMSFAGVFIYTVFTSLTKAPLLVKNHPYLEENKYQNT